MTTVLGIESSCDETAAAVVIDGRRVVGSVVASQFDLHEKYGGVVPEIASRAHIERLDAVIAEAMSQAGVARDDIDLIAGTTHPGLVGCLLIGSIAAKTLAWSWSKPLIAVNHVHAHVTSAAIEAPERPWPAVGLVVSGGHTSLCHIRDFDAIETIGSTTDDAAGEAFDKVASILNLGYPGGPIIDKIARQGDPGAIRFPRTMLKRGSLDFSFSGIKTAVLYHVHGQGKTSGGLEKLSEQDIADIAASFQAAVVDVLVTKTLMAVKHTGVRTVVAGGGVTANSALRTGLTEACEQGGVTLHMPSFAYCTDNAAMIAALGYHLHAKGHRSGLDTSVRASM